MAVEQLKILNNCAISAIVGLALTSFFDIVSLIIESFDAKHKKVIFFIKDFVLMLSYTTVFILILYYCSNGVIRGLYIFSMICASSAYLMLLRNIFRIVIGALLFPIKFVLEVIIKILRKIKNFLLHTIEKIELRMYNKIE